MLLCYIFGGSCRFSDLGYNLLTPVIRSLAVSPVEADTVRKISIQLKEGFKKRQNVDNYR